MSELVDRVRQGRIEPDPFPHVVLDPLVAAPCASDLAATFPSDLLVASKRQSGSDKTYAVAAHTIYDAAAGGWSSGFGTLSPAWRELCETLIGPDYIAAVCGLLGVAVDVDLELRFTEYGPGQGMSRHTDRPSKAFSQLIYCCPSWQPAWGGALALYAAVVGPPTRLVVPGLGSSVLFRRRESSWHEVLPIAPSAPAGRRALLVHGRVRPAP
jgi:hypothetical protein